MDIYYSSQFAPLVVFFLLFLAVVKNTKLPHFVRFNCMQGIMIDIVTMLFNILRTYFPAELRWSSVLDVRSRCPSHMRSLSNPTLPIKLCCWSAVAAPAWVAS